MLTAPNAVILATLKLEAEQIGSLLLLVKITVVGGVDSADTLPVQTFYLA